MARIYTAKYLVPVDAPPIVGGALLDFEGTIAAVGSLADLKRSYPNIEIIDFADSIIAPLLINSHTHLELTDFPGWAEAAGESNDPIDFVDWILRLIRVKRTLSKKQYDQSLAHGIEHSLAAGTGAVGDILSQHSSRKMYKNSSLHGTLYLEILGHDPAIISRFRQELRTILAEEQIGQVRLGLSPHSPYTISADYLSEIYDKCKQHNLPCTTHLAESPDEVTFIEQSCGDLAEKFYHYVGWTYLIPEPSGKRPAEYLQKRGGIFPENLLVHGVQLNSAEIDLLAKNGTNLALCPRSNARLNVGKAPVAELQSAGVKLCLGTDSMASNDSLSVWDELAFAHSWFSGATDAPALLQMATVNGADALGLSSKLGSLTTSKFTSFQVLSNAEKFAENEIFDYLAAPGRSADITHVYQQGRTVLP